MSEKKIELEAMSNNEILLEMKQMEADHEGIKLKMLQDYEKMEAIEALYDKAQHIINKRLKG